MELLVGALRDLAARMPPPAARRPAVHAPRPAPPFTRQVLSPRDAFFAPRWRATAECAGEVSAEMVTPYPPGIPVLGPGEEISPEIVAYLREASATGLKVHGPEDRTLRTLRVVA